MLIVVMDYGRDMPSNRFYRKPSKETMDKRKAEYSEMYKAEIEWFTKNLVEVSKDKFLMDMYKILLTGSRPMSPKMVGAIHKGMNSWKFDIVERTKRQEKLNPIIKKIKVLLEVIEKVDGAKINTKYSAYGFVESVHKQATKNLSLTEKQMTALNKTFKKYNEKLEEKIEKNKEGK